MKRKSILHVGDVKELKNDLTVLRSEVKPGQTNAILVLAGSSVKVKQYPETSTTAGITVLGMEEGMLFIEKGDLLKAVKL